MADFKTHITVSTATGVAYGAAGLMYGDMPPATCLLAGGLCSVSGMLPDLDSDSGVPLRESVAFAAAVVPMLMISRWRALGMSPEAMALAGAFVYLLVRFGLGWFLKKYTVHRGMFHSIPAAIIATELTFLVFSHEDISRRYFVALAVAAGFMSHLILDEIWSVGVKRGQLALKKSFGTAVKFWGNSLYANVSCYAKLLILSYLVLQDPVWMYNDRPQSERFLQMAENLIDRVRGRRPGEGTDDMPPLREISRDELRRGTQEIAVEPPAPRGYAGPLDERGYDARSYETRGYDARGYDAQQGVQGDGAHERAAVRNRGRYAPQDDPFWQDREAEEAIPESPAPASRWYYNGQRPAPGRLPYPR